MSLQKNKRLFLFAGYDPRGIIDDALVYYIRSLARLGDVFLVMDSDCDDGQMKKIRPHVKYAAAARHGEYDFGSYKRAYTAARDAGILGEYDFVYMVNDSVYGPLRDLGPVLAEMESMQTDAFGIVCNPKPSHPHIQSWFIGMRPAVFMSKWFAEFILSVKKLESKGLITRMYEHRFSALVREHQMCWSCLWTVRNRGVYNRVKQLYRRGMPFMKKVAFSRHNGALGRQISYVMRHIPVAARDAILSGARQTFGDEYVQRLLTRNPAKILIRNLRHCVRKLFGEEI